MDKSAAESRTIIHTDMDAFYASVEILDNPELRGKPVVVGGLSNRSVVSAASYEARKFGIHSAMPTSTARTLCRDAVFMPVRMARYREISTRIMAIFHRFTPLVEPISLDEAFLDVTGSGRLFGTGAEIAADIRKTISRETGLTASAGVASSKLLAKIASDLQKPDGLTVVEPGREREFLAALPINKLWGVGQTTLKSLRMLSVRTIGDLTRLPLELLTSKYGKHGVHLFYAARGIDNRPVEPVHEAKSIGHEDTFSEDLKDLGLIKKELLALACRVGARLRRHEKEGKTVSLKVKFNDFTTNTRSQTLMEATADNMEIYHHCLGLLAKTEAGRTPIRLLGISISNLGSELAGHQPDLFGVHRNREKKKNLCGAVDRLNRKFGIKTVKPARLIDNDSTF
ncbi:MAG: DNA polymerase IV [Desulfobulbales bacterium]|nr:DNA polymerase IV [Desulfobulbales bacterium]